MIDSEGQEPQGIKVEGTEARAARFFVGATKNPDGSIDYSNALYAKPGSETEASLIESSNASEERQRVQRQEKINDFDAKISTYEGTASGVFYQLEKSLFLGREGVKAGDERRAKLTANLELQQSVLREVSIGEPSLVEVTKRLEGLREKLQNQVMAGDETVNFSGHSYKVAEVYDAVRELGAKIDVESQKEIRTDAVKESKAEDKKGPEVSAEELESARKGFERAVNFLVSTLEHPDTRGLFQPFRNSDPTVEDYNRFAKDVMALNKKYMGEPRKSDQLKKDYLDQVRALVGKEIA